MTYDIKDLTHSAFAEKIMTLAEQHKVGVPVMIGACLITLRALYTVLPAPAKRDYINDLHRFLNELEHQNPTVIH